MDFLNLVAAARRHWVIVLIGVLAGGLVATASLYALDRSDGSTKLEPRSFTEYTLEMQLIVIDPLFGLGRAGTNVNQPDLFQKTVALSNTYAELLTSDAVQGAATRKVGPPQAEITSEAMDGSPIILLSLKGKDPEQMAKYGKALAEALQAYLKEEQEAQDISPKDSMSVRLLSTAQPKAVQSRRLERGLLAFLGPVALAFGFALVKEKS